ncbi:MAG: hypothetical protein AAF721_42020 [Myxococcota bacterium]
MPPTRPLSTAMSLCLALAMGVASVQPAQGAPPRETASETTSPPTVLLWPTNRQMQVRPAEAAVLSAGHELVRFEPVATAIQEGGADHRAAATATIARVEEGLARAQDHYLAQSWDAMLSELATQESDALSVLADGGSCQTLWKLEFRAGLGRGARKGPGDAEAQTEHFVMAFSMRPSERPLADLYGPDVSAAFLAAIDNANARATRPTPITVEPEDAQVLVDCRVVDRTTEVALRPGRHAVVVRAPGYIAHAEIVTLAAGDPLTIELTPDPTSDPVARLVRTWPRDVLPDGPSSRSLIAAIAAELGASEWVTLAETEAGVRASLWRQGRRFGMVERGTAADAAVAVLRPPAPRPSVGRAPRKDPVVVGPVEPRTDGTRKRLVTRWWFWTAIAAGAVATGLGLGLGLGLRRNQPPSRLEVTVR